MGTREVVPEKVFGKTIFTSIFKKQTKNNLLKELNANEKRGEIDYTNNDIPVIKKIPMSKDNIITILDTCIENHKENINIEFLEDDYEQDPNYEIYIEKYLENYILLLRGIKDKLLENTKIIDGYGAEILKHLEAIQNKRELALCQINILAEFILKTYGKKYNQITQDTFIEWGIGKLNNDILDFIVKN